MNKNILLPLVILLSIACDRAEKKDGVQEQESKSVYIKKYTYPELTEQSLSSVSNWYEFKTIYQILLSISPDRQSVPILQYSNPDSLYVYKRLYPNTSQNKLSNGTIQRDWRASESPTDTIYKFVKKKADEQAFFAWEEILLKDIPYTFSIKVTPSSGIKKVKMEIIRQKDNKPIREQFLRLDTLSYNTLEPYTQLATLKENWIKVNMQVQTPLYGEYTFAIYYDEQEVAEDYISFYNTELLLPVKYQSEIEKSAEKLLGQKKVKSSYNSIYFWLFQLEDEIRQLWVKDNFPEKLNRDEVKARLKLFETYVRNLSSNVKENSSLTKEEVQQGILDIRNAFSSVIRYINFINDEKLEDKIGNLLGSPDSLTIKPSEHSSL
jgi:hypothetical protein